MFARDSRVDGASFVISSEIVKAFRKFINRAAVDDVKSHLDQVVQGVTLDRLGGFNSSLVLGWVVLEVHALTLQATLLSFRDD